MEYRRLPHVEEKLSVIGMGSSFIGEADEKEIIRTVHAALAAGMNLFDLAAGHVSVFKAYGKALKKHRQKMFLQIHFGANYMCGRDEFLLERRSIFCFVVLCGSGSCSAGRLRTLSSVPSLIASS